MNNLYIIFIYNNNIGLVNGDKFSDEFLYFMICICILYIRIYGIYELYTIFNNGTTITVSIYLCRFFSVASFCFVRPQYKFLLEEKGYDT